MYVWSFVKPLRTSLPTPPPDIRRVGNGPNRGAMWPEGVPCIVGGFHEWPKVGDTVVIVGVLKRLVEISDLWV